MLEQDLKYFQNMLLEEKKEIMDEIAKLQDKISSAEIIEDSGDLSQYPSHQADISDLNYNREMLVEDLERLQNKLKDIKEALLLIDNGTYGKCQKCGDFIPKERLDVVPHAKLCIKCKKESEKF